MAKKYYGVDLSAYNHVYNYPKLNRDFDFFYIKITEGTPTPNWNAKDAAAMKHFRNLKHPKMLYHFPHPKYNDAITSSNYFLSEADKFDNHDGYILDMEEFSGVYIWANGPVDWAYKWLKNVMDKTGKMPLLYLSTSKINAYDWTRVAELGVPLIEANYGSKRDGKFHKINKKVKYWGKSDIHQYSSSGTSSAVKGFIDLNIAYNLDFLNNDIMEKNNEIRGNSERGTIYSQADPRWAKLTLGYNTNPIWNFKNWACLITTQAMILTEVLGTIVTPIDVNEKLKKVGGFTQGGGDYIVGKITEAYPGLKEVLTNTMTSEVKDIQFAEINAALDEDKYVMLMVDFNPFTSRLETHYVRAVNYRKKGKEWDYFIADPIDGKFRWMSEKYTGAYRLLNRYTIHQYLIYTYQGKKNEKETKELNLSKRVPKEHWIDEMKALVQAGAIERDDAIDTMLVKFLERYKSEQELIKLVKVQKENFDEEKNILETKIANLSARNKNLINDTNSKEAIINKLKEEVENLKIQKDTILENKVKSLSAKQLVVILMGKLWFSKN